jgi:ATP-dependent DNA helicase HFM1/MER3
VFSYKNTTTSFLFDNSLNYKIFDLLKRYGNCKPTLIFCSSRKGCMQAAKQVTKEYMTNH